MNLKRLINATLLLLIFTFANLYANDKIKSNRKLHFTRLENVEHQHILFVTATKGYYQCVSDYARYTKFTNPKIKSINVNLTYASNHNSLNFYETLIRTKITEEKYDYVIIVDETANFSKEFYDFIKEKFNKKSVVISYVNFGDIQLIANFNKLILLLHQIEPFVEFNLYFIHNENNKLTTFYKDILKSQLDSHNLYGMSIKYVKDLRLFLNKIKEDQHNIILSSTDYLIDDVTGSLIQLEDILDELYTKNITVIISHNTCKPVNSKFSMYWCIRKLTNNIELLFKEPSDKPIIIESSLGINLYLNKDLIDKLDFSSIESILKNTDTVIYNE